MATKKKTQYVLVRSGQSGVWIGVLVSRKGDEVTLTKALKIWRWRGANTTSELALHGCDSNGYTRVAEPVDTTIIGVCEVLISNAAVYERISKCGWAK